MKKLYETQEDVTRMYSLSDHDAKLLVEFSKDLRSVINPWKKHFPQHLVSCLPRLTRDIIGHILPEPGQLSQKPSLEENIALYKVFSLDQEGRTVEWFYNDEREQPLVNYIQNIVLHIFLNTDGLIFLINALDQCFCDTEAIYLDEYLRLAYGNQVQIKIDQVRLPVSFEITNLDFELSHNGYGSVELLKMEGFDLGFKVLGVIKSESCVKDRTETLFKKPTE